MLFSSCGVYSRTQLKKKQRRQETFAFYDTIFFKHRKDLVCVNCDTSEMSGRPVTSVPASEASTSADTVTDSSDVDHIRTALTQDTFVPHVFDFVTIARYAGNMVRSNIPSLFLEPLAVDQSTIIGDGASFSAFRKALPSPPTWSETHSLDGMSITMSNPKDDVPSHVVYKVARVAFTDTGQPTAETRQAMKAAMMEMFALVHPPLLKHSNIVDFLGLAWGSNFYDPSHRLPVLVVEYADHGNLAQLQESKNLEPQTRSSLALDIGEGIKILHRCGIIHGDVKSENVLIFAHPDKKYLAKVADFGFSLVGEAADAEVHIGGTKPWKAPEAQKRLAKQFLKATDVYSYGLLLWRLATDGKDPFRFLPASELKGDSYLDTLERFKELDDPAKNIAIEKWYLPYIIAEQKDRKTELSPDWLARTISNLRLLTTETEAGQATRNQALANMYPMLKDTLRMCLLTSQPTDSIGQMLLTWAQKDSFYGRISSALSRCLSLSPQNRDLEATLSALRGNPSTETVYVIKCANFSLANEY
jgi:serine/threonine protein kinase